MAKKSVRLEWNSAGFRQILASGAVTKDITRRTEAIAAAAGEGMDARFNHDGVRLRGTVITATYEARRAEAAEKALSSAIDAGRG